MDTLRISYRWTVDELLEAQKAHNGTILSPFIVIVLTVFYSLMTCLGVTIIALEIQRGHEISSFSIGFTAFWLIWLALIQLSSGPVHRFLVERRFSRRKDANAQVSFELLPTGLKLSTLGAVEASFACSQFTKLYEGKNGYLLYFGKQFYWLPNLAFDGEESKERLKSWALDANIPVIVRGKRVRR